MFEGDVVAEAAVLINVLMKCYFELIQVNEVCFSVSMHMGTVSTSAANIV